MMKTKTSWKKNLFWILRTFKFENFSLSFQQFFHSIAFSVLNYLFCNAFNLELIINILERQTKFFHAREVCWRFLRIDKNQQNSHEGEKREKFKQENVCVLNKFLQVSTLFISDSFVLSFHRFHRFEFTTKNSWDQKFKHQRLVKISKMKRTEEKIVQNSLLEVL